ncbi:type VII secretion target [Actinoplanes sp. NPDC049118]|uniref:type VII secretion target n=1 Tax=Actinoplanes sp. NPDC049118 TaxID=3155769 RepID=UPI0033C1AA09
MSDGSISVETGGLDRFAGDVGFYAVEVDPLDVDRARQSFSAGITFGRRNASVPLLHTKENYGKALANSLTNLSRFVEAAKILADAAEQAAREYRAVDDRSARSIDNINYMLTTAAERAQAVRDGRTTL